VAPSLASRAVLYFATNAFSCSALAARAKSPGMIKSVVIKSSDFMKESENVSDEGTSRNREEWKDAKHSIHSLVTSIDWSGIFWRK
jgi:hypothetical protein